MDTNNQPCARLCHITKWDHFDGYGFNLHAEKGKIGQFIGKVDDGSPSEAAGLRQGDRIIEVNEINIANETHKQVVERIKAFPTETKLLVVDQIADSYYKSNNIPIKGGMTGVKYMKTPERNYDDEDNDEMVATRGATTTIDEMDDGKIFMSKSSNNAISNGSQGTTSDTHSIASSGHSSAASIGKENGNNTTNFDNNGNSNNDKTEDDNISNKSTSSKSSSKDAIKSSTTTTTANGSGGNDDVGGGGSLNLQMSAKELRAKLAARKKYDPKKASMGFKDKFDIVQKL